MTIVERLRHRYPQWELGAELRAGHPSVAWEAAEEIERLRALSPDNMPKNESEWWIALKDQNREIERLREIREKEGNEIERLRAVITRAKDALLDGQSTQWVHDLLVAALLEPMP